MVAGYRFNSPSQTKLIPAPNQALKNIGKSTPAACASRSGLWMRHMLGAIVLAALCAVPVRADEVADIFQKLQNDPQNAALNLQYARAAEKAGKLKWALPAYERALSADPGNPEAKAGIDRITNKLRAEANPS
jgi:hypothetical protein